MGAQAPDPEKDQFFPEAEVRVEEDSRPDVPDGGRVMVEVHNQDGSVTQKIMLSLGGKNYQILENEARARDLQTVQELLRAVVIPDWLKTESAKR